jgi:uncharacterized protein YndB with AHSA1/START domain
VSSTWGGSIVLDHPPAVVWDFLTSESNDVNWRGPWLVAVRKISDGPMVIGTRYESDYSFFGRRDTVVTEITEAVVPRRLAWKQVGRGTLAINDGSYDLEPVGNRTRFTVRGVFESRGLSRLADAPFALYLHQAAKRQHAQLAAALARHGDR